MRKLFAILSVVGLLMAGIAAAPASADRTTGAQKQCEKQGGTFINAAPLAQVCLGPAD